MSSQLPKDDGDLMNEAIHCPQCKQRYGPSSTVREAKLLGCLDTFCAECLQKHIQDLSSNYPWQTVSCQLCQTPFDGKNDSVRTNPVVDTLLKIEAITSDPNGGHRSPCDACAGEDSNGDMIDVEVPFAEVYCEECDQKLCAVCHSAHGKLRQTKSHAKVVPLGSQESRIVTRSWKELLPRCSFHAAQSDGEYFCGACRVFVCVVCAKEHTEKHKSPCRPAVQVTQELRNALIKQSNEVAKLEIESKARQEMVKQKRKLFAESFNIASKEIEERTESMHRIIDLHRAELITQLEKIRLETDEEFEEELDSAKRNELRVNRFVKFTDLTKTVDLVTLQVLLPMVNQRASELRKTRCTEGVPSIDVNLGPGSWQQVVATSASNCIGCLDVRRLPLPPKT